MSKTLSQLSFEDIVKNELAKAFKDYEENYDHETESDYAPYGDTFCRSGTYVSDESAERCRDDFKESFDAYDFIVNYLQESSDFRDKIEELLTGMRL